MMTNSISPSRHVSVPSDVLVQQIEGEAVLLNLDSGRYFGLDPVGNSMFNALVSSESVYDAYESLLAEYDVEVETLQRDLQNLIQKLVKYELVEVALRNQVD